MLFLKDGTMKLADFGLARMYGTPKQRLSPQAITLWYKPPELLLGASQYSSAADMWSVGCIFAELLLRRPFLQGNQTDISQLDKIFTVFGTPNQTNWPDYGMLPRRKLVPLVVARSTEVRSVALFPCRGYSQWLSSVRRSSGKALAC